MTDLIEIIRSNRKTVSIEISNDLRIIVRAPIKASRAYIDKVIKDKSEWIKKNYEMVKNRNSSKNAYGGNPFTDSELKILKERAKSSIPPVVAACAKRIGITYNKITIRAQVSRWGSCSSNSNLNFNCLLILCPSEVLEYVVIHELCHISHRNHSKYFWSMVEKYCPNYKESQRWLNDNGNALIKRLR